MTDNRKTLQALDDSELEQISGGNSRQTVSESGGLNIWSLSKLIADNLMAQYSDTNLSDEAIRAYIIENVSFAEMIDMNTLVIEVRKRIVEYYKWS